MKIVTRFAPSPTGLLHAGNYRTAIFSYLFARQNKGKFILRIEDSDRVRSKKEYEDNILDSLKWLGLEYDSFYRQSDRVSNHRAALQKLIDGGFAFIAKETPKEEGERDEVIRFKNPNKKVRFHDAIRGDIEFDTTEQGDFVVARSMDEPVFHLAVVIDDHEMGVTHVIRGEDHISNTARHILIYEALGFPVPIYAHVPLLLSPDRSKLSKRKGALPITVYRDKGYLPEALINYMALLGWNPGTEKEIFNTQELLAEFKLEKIQKSSAVFDEEKLSWFNRQYILKLTNAQFTAAAGRFIPDWLKANNELLERLIPVIREKINAFGEISTLFAPAGELAFVKESHQFPAELILWKKNPDSVAARKHLSKAAELIGSLSDSEFTADRIKKILWPYAEAEGKGDVLWPMRVALTGQEKSPDPFMCAFILGKEETMKRIDGAVGKLTG